MALQDIVNVNISKSGPGVTQTGFGIPLVLGSSSKISPDRIRTYGSISDVAADFATSDAEYKAANAIFAQSPKPSKIKIGRRLAEATQIVTVTPDISVQAIQHYIQTINGVVFDFTSDATPTAAEVVTGLSALINAAVGLGVTASGSTTLILTANVQGVAFTYSESANLVAVLSTANHGIPEDLFTIQGIDNDWYAIMITSRADHDLLNLASWTESQLKMACVCSADVNALLASSTTDAFYLLKQKKYARTFGIWSADQADYPDAAWLGRMLPVDLAPNSDDWDLVSLQGIVADVLTGTQQQQLKARNANYYITIAGVDATQDGRVFDSEYVDSIRGIDWFQQRLEERIFGDMINKPKIPYTDAGASFIENEVRAQIAAGQRIGVIANSPDPTVVVPSVLSQTASDRAARKYPGTTFTWRLAGAIQQMDINGFVSV